MPPKLAMPPKAWPLALPTCGGGGDGIGGGGEWPVGGGGDGDGGGIAVDVDRASRWWRRLNVDDEDDVAFEGIKPYADTAGVNFGMYGGVESSRIGPRAVCTCRPARL